jgi:hypothetical protein
LTVGGFAEGGVLAVGALRTGARGEAFPVPDGLGIAEGAPETGKATGVGAKIDEGAEEVDVNARTSEAAGNGVAEAVAESATSDSLALRGAAIFITPTIPMAPPTTAAERAMKSARRFGRGGLGDAVKGEEVIPAGARSSDTDGPTSSWGLPNVASS